MSPCHAYAANSLGGRIKDEITLDKLLPARMVVFAGPRDKFTAAEFDAIQNYISSGGAVLVLLGEGGETRFDTNINFLLEEYGIVVNAGLIGRRRYQNTGFAY